MRFSCDLVLCCGMHFAPDFFSVQLPGCIIAPDIDGMHWLLLNSIIVGSILVGRDALLAPE